MQFPSRTIVISALLFCLASPGAVFAAYTSTVAGSTATMTGDAAGDTLSITQAGGLFRHNRFTLGDPGFNSDFDFDTSVVGDQTVSSTTGIINVNAGDGNDTIALGDGVNVRGAIDGGVGTDTLDYSAYTTAVGANLGLGSTGSSATLGADQENPSTTHIATATATISNYSITAHTFDITVTVSDLLPGDVTGFHIHQAPVGVNGPIIVDFTGLAPLVPVGSGFVFTAVGVALPAINEAAFLGGGTYVNIHTTAFPGGAIRGQVFSAGNVNLSTGAATGTTSVTNIENVTGGAGGDSLVGSSAVNTINGGSGADWIVGGPGNDILNGGAGADVLVWSNGDGTDVDEGGADSDTVQVNGSTAAADIFLVGANGTRINFARTNLGLFSLDIGTVETLIVNGIAGDDTFTVNDLTGVASLTTLNLNGFAGADTFTVVPRSAGGGAFNARGGEGTDTLNYNAGSRAISGDRTAPNGLIVSPGRQSVGFMQVETINILNVGGISNDYDGDGKADITVFRPSTGTWFALLSNDSTLGTVNWGTSTDVRVPGDYDGDGASDVAVYRPSTGTWFILASTAGYSTVNWGGGIDIPVPADYDFDGKTDIAVYRPSTGTWFIRASTAGFAAVNWGSSIDVPVPGDYDSDGKADIAVYRSTTGTWYILQSNNSTLSTVQWGAPGIDLPVVGDYDGDGKTDIAVYRASTGTWFIRASTAGAASVNWGFGNDVPVPADYDGDGKTDVAVYRSSIGTWYILESSTFELSTVVWGSTTDIPVSRRP